MTKLDIQHKHVLKLIARDCNADGWAKVSKTLFKMLSENIPSELVKFEELDNGGRAQLTKEGQGVVDALVWL